MTPEPHPAEEVSRGQTVEATLWRTIARLRARGWHISLWEVQRAQDVIAYLFVRLERPPTDDELHRHLRPVLCARESELGPFSEVFQEGAAAPPPPDAAARSRRRRGRGWLLGLAVAVVLAVAGFVIFLPDSAGPSDVHSSRGTALVRVFSLWTTWAWVGGVVGSVAAAAGLLWLATRKRLQRRPAPRDPGHDLELRWATDHPLETVECVRIARSLRARARERGDLLDLRRTVEASIRAGLRLTPCFVEHKRVPEYLAVIEQRSAQDVLAAYYARVVDQVSGQGVAVRRVGLQPRSALVIDPVRGQRRLETLQPTSERERLLLFAPDWSLRDPFSGRPRQWLHRFDRWSETIQIGPDVNHDRSLPVVDRVLTDVRSLDPGWARTEQNGRPGAAPVLPAVFESGDELWVEPCAPSGPDVARALDLLATSLGPSGWYWLSACALYPEINYELTVALGRLLKGDRGEPVAAHLDVAMLARLPWFRHAYMPDWLRSTLISTLSAGQLVEAREALDEILVSGLLGAADGSSGLSVAEPRPGVGRGSRGSQSPRHAAAAQDRVYLDGSALRRRRLAAAAPRQLVAAVRRQRHRFALPMPAVDAPAPRVRRALAWNNGLLAVEALATSALSVTAWIEVGFTAWWRDSGGSVNTALSMITALSYVSAAIALIFSLLARRWRGVVVGLSSAVFFAALFICARWGNAVESAEEDAVVATTLLSARLLTLGSITAALLLPRAARPVQWSSFQGRNRSAFFVAAGVVVAIVGGWMVTTANLVEGWTQLTRDPVWGDVIESSAVFVVFAAAPILLAAAYFAGVRLIPLVAGGTILAFCAGAGMAGDTRLLLSLAFPAALVLAGFYWQFRRTVEWPPLDFWETRWREWKWPLTVLTVAATATVTWFLSKAWDVVLVISAVPATVALLNLAYNLTLDRLARVIQLGSRFPLHFD